jgi:hypothetical protein
VVLTFHDAAVFGDSLDSHVMATHFAVFGGRLSSHFPKTRSPERVCAVAHLLGGGVQTDCGVALFVAVSPLCKRHVSWLGACETT